MPIGAQGLYLFQILKDTLLHVLIILYGCLDMKVFINGNYKIADTLSGLMDDN